MRKNIIVLLLISLFFSSEPAFSAYEEINRTAPLMRDTVSYRVSHQSDKRPFTTRQDTLVFIPSNFFLQTDSRLFELLRQLPGISQQEGQLYWLDKPLTVTVNQESLFNSNGNLGSVPCELIEKLQLYNSASDLKAQTGNNDQEEDYTLNLVLHPDADVRWRSHMHAAYQTARHYDVGAEVVHLAFPSPMLLFVNANDLNQSLSSNDFLQEHSHIGQFGRQQMAALSFQHNWQTSPPEVLTNRYLCNADLQHKDHWGENFQYQETYFLDGTTHYLLSNQDQHANHWAPSFFGEVKWNLDAKSTLKIQGEALYHKTNASALTKEAQLKSPPFNWSSRPLEDIFTDDETTPIRGQVLSRDISQSNTWGHHSRFHLSAEWNRLLTAHSQFFLNADLSYSDQLEEEESNYQLDVTSIWSNKKSQHYDTHPTQHFTTELRAFYKLWLSRHLMFSSTYSYAYAHRYEKQEHYQSSIEEYNREELMEQFDETNSFRHTDNHHHHLWSSALVYNLHRFSVIPSLSWSSEQEEARHLRTRLDTLLRRHTATWQPALKIRWQPTPWVQSKLEYRYSTERPLLFNTIPWVDTTNPVYRFEGNEHLHASYLHTVQFSLTGAVPQRQIIYGAWVSLNHNSSPVTRAYSYDETTGTFTARPQNALRPTFALNSHLHFQQYLSSHWQIQMDLKYDIKNRDGFLTSSPQYEQLQSNRQHIAETTIAPQLTYESPAHFKCTVYSDLVFTRNRYKIYKRNYHPLRQYNNGLRVEKELGAFHFYSDIHDLIYRGYLNQQINGHHVLWSVAAAWYCCKGKGKLSLTCDDLLNNTLLYSRVIEPHQHTEYYKNQLHHFLQLSFSYRFSPAKRNKD